MHDIDRTQLEFSEEAWPTHSEELEFEFEGELMGNELSELEEIQLAHELLSVTNEQELDQFLGSFLKKAAGAVGSVLKSPVGQAIGGVLKSVAKRALPMAGTALGSAIGGPLGAKIGSGLANVAGKALGLEYEFGESEELEVQGARQFVRLANQVAKQTAAATAAGANPRTTAQSAAVAAARKFAPGLISAAHQAQTMTPAFGSPGMMAAPMHHGRHHSGRWVRHGNRIIVYGV